VPADGARARIGGIGVDVCEIGRVRRLLAGATAHRFRDRVFTSREQAYCEARGRTRAQSYAVRFAAKEAAMKALGTGWGQGVGFRDVEVLRDGDEAPRIVLHGAAARMARRRGLVFWHVTLTHTRTTAMAWVLAERA
jgi:holo-[acyl-carrier protein] synthase